MSDARLREAQARYKSPSIIGPRFGTDEDRRRWVTELLRAGKIRGGVRVQLKGLVPCYTRWYRIKFYGTKAEAAGHLLMLQGLHRTTGAGLSGAKHLVSAGIDPVEFWLNYLTDLHEDE